MSSHDVAVHSDSEPEAPAGDSPVPIPMIERTLKGSCHCKFITYEVTVPLPVRPNVPIATRCNCTICLKSGFTSLSIPSPDKNFKLLTPKPSPSSPSSTSSAFDNLPTYQFNSPNIHRHFCSTCGVTVLGRGYYEFDGQKVDFFAVNLATIDQPQEGVELSAFKMEYWDGRRDAWARGKKDSPYEGGLV